MSRAEPLSPDTRLAIYLSLTRDNGAPAAKRGYVPWSDLDDEQRARKRQCTRAFRCLQRCAEARDTELFDGLRDSLQGRFSGTAFGMPIHAALAEHGDGQCNAAACVRVSELMSRLLQPAECHEVGASSVMRLFACTDALESVVRNIERADARGELAERSCSEALLCELCSALVQSADFARFCRIVRIRGPSKRAARNE